MNPKTKISKKIAYYLRHQPDELGITLDTEGWVNVDWFLERWATVNKLELTLSLLEEIVAADSKGRYSFRVDENGVRQLRANQGHSTDEVNLTFESVIPKGNLYHGTTQERWQLIKKSDGLKPMNRHHVHLSDDVETAKIVAGRHRHETPKILVVVAPLMHVHGLKFYRSENGVWLTESVPMRYIIPLLPEKT